MFICLRNKCVFKGTTILITFYLLCENVAYFPDIFLAILAATEAECPVPERGRDADSKDKKEPKLGSHFPAIQVFITRLNKVEWPRGKKGLPLGRIAWFTLFSRMWFILLVCPRNIARTSAFLDLYHYLGLSIESYISCLCVRISC